MHTAELGFGSESEQLDLNPVERAKNSLEGLDRFLRMNRTSAEAPAYYGLRPSALTDVRVDRLVVPKFAIEIENTAHGAIQGAVECHVMLPLDLTPFLRGQIMSGMLAGLPNAELLNRVRDLVCRGNAVEAELVAHLAEVDARQLYLEEGCSSMFMYCQRVLHFAEGVAYKRIQAARAARRHPQILEALRSGDLHLTALGLLAPKLTTDNCAALIRGARHLGADEIIGPAQTGAEAEVCGYLFTPACVFYEGELVTTYPRRYPASRVAARRRTLHLCLGGRTALQLQGIRGIRSRRSLDVDKSAPGRRNHAALPCAQSTDGAPRFRISTHGPLPANWM